MMKTQIHPNSSQTKNEKGKNYKKKIPAFVVWAAVGKLNPGGHYSLFSFLFWPSEFIEIL